MLWEIERKPIMEDNERFVWAERGRSYVSANISSTMFLDCNLLDFLVDKFKSFSISLLYIFGDDL